MARLICNDCFNVVMFGGNVKSGNACPKCGSDNTTKGATIKFNCLSIKHFYSDDISWWTEAVKIHNAQVCA